MTETKQAYVGEEDRPEIAADLDTPVAQLRVRDLMHILARRGFKPHPKFEGHSPLKEFFDKPFPEVLTQFGFSPVPGPGPDPFGGGGSLNVLLHQTQAVSAAVQRLEDQVAQLEKRVG
jgi:hypothetical protein